MENSPLNKLAAELRNRIYDFTLKRDNGLIIDTTSLAPKLTPQHDTRNLAALTQTCKQIHQESLPILLNNDIEILTEAGAAYENYHKAGPLGVEIKIGINKLKLFLYALGPHAPSPQNLTLNLGAWKAAPDRDWNRRQPKCIAYLAKEFQAVCKSYNTRAEMKIKLGKPLPLPCALPYGILPFILPDPTRFELFLKLDGGDAGEVSNNLSQCVKAIAFEQKREHAAVGVSCSGNLALAYAKELGVCVVEELAGDEAWSFQACKLERGG